jgi:hypothetical protein
MKIDNQSQADLLNFTYQIVRRESFVKKKQASIFLLITKQLESKPTLYRSSDFQKSLKRLRSSSAEPIPIAPKPFNTARQRLHEQVSKEPVKSADDFLRSTLLTP